MRTRERERGQRPGFGGSGTGGVRPITSAASSAVTDERAVPTAPAATVPRPCRPLQHRYQRSGHSELINISTLSTRLEPAITYCNSSAARELRALEEKFSGRRAPLPRTAVPREQAHDNDREAKTAARTKENRGRTSCCPVVKLIERIGSAQMPPPVGGGFALAPTKGHSGR